MAPVHHKGSSTYLGDLAAYAGAGQPCRRLAGTFRWTDAYRVHLEVPDRQPQQLFDAVNELDQALRAGQGKSRSIRFAKN